MMLEWFDEHDAADRFETAFAQVIEEERTKTYDMGGETTSSEMAEAIAEKL